jgi:hypothetical protein
MNYQGVADVGMDMDSGQLRSDAVNGDWLEHQHPMSQVELQRVQSIFKMSAPTLRKAIRQGSFPEPNSRAQRGSPLWWYAGILVEFRRQRYEASRKHLLMQLQNNPQLRYPAQPATLPSEIIVRRHRLRR